jgi:hypothetical protein
MQMIVMMINMILKLFKINGFIGSVLSKKVIKYLFKSKYNTSKIKAIFMH